MGEEGNLTDRRHMTVAEKSRQRRSWRVCRHSTWQSHTHTHTTLDVHGPNLTGPRDQFDKVVARWDAVFEGACRRIDRTVCFRVYLMGFFTYIGVNLHFTADSPGTLHRSAVHRPNSALTAPAWHGSGGLPVCGLCRRPRAHAPLPPRQQRHTPQCSHLPHRPALAPPQCTGTGRCGAASS